jgi:ankyrin repeat protein
MPMNLRELMPNLLNNKLELTGEVYDCIKESEFKDKISLFTNAVRFGGHIHLLQFLLDLPIEPDLRNEMIHAYRDTAFKDAAKYGRIDILNLLLENTPDSELRNKMIHNYADTAFRWAAEGA